MHYLEEDLRRWLRISPDGLDRIDQSLFDGLWFWDLEQPDNSWISSSFWAELGYAPDTQPHLTRAWREHVEPGDLRRAETLLKLANPDASAPLDQFMRMRHAAGHWLWMRCRGLWRHGPMGAPVRLLIAVTNATTMLARLRARACVLGDTLDAAPGLRGFDVLPRPASEPADASARLAHRLNEAEANFQTFFNAIDDFIFVIDQDGRILHVNRAVERKLGFDRAELIGQHVLDVHPEERHAEAAAIVGDMLRGTRQMCPIPLLTRDQRQIPVETRVYRGTWNGALALFGIARDLSAVATSEEKFTRLFSLAPVAMILARLSDTLIVDTNSAFSSVLGYRAAEAVDRTLLEIGLFIDVEQHQAMVEQVNAGVEVKDFEALVKARSGRILVGLCSARSIDLRADRLLLIAMVDVTALKRAEATLAKEKQLLNALFESIPDLIWLKDPDGVYLACNSRFEQYLGVPRARIIGRTDQDFIDPELARRRRAHDCHAFSALTPSVSEECLRFASDGHEEWVEIIATAVADDDGERIGVLGIARNISERKAREEATQLLASVFSATRDGILICDRHEKIQETNPAFADMTGYTREELLGKTPRMLSSGRQAPEIYANMWQCIERDGFWKGELWNRHRNGAFYAVQCNISALKDHRGQVAHYIGVFSDITPLKLQQERLHRLAHYDALTQLPNRQLLTDRLDMALSRARRERSLLAVCFVDLDRFKPINDGLGHNAGDQVLIEIARRLKAQIREDDTVARLGGDEFVLLLNDAGDPDSLRKILERLIDEINAPMWIGGNQLFVHASIGVALGTPEPGDSECLLRCADQAMYRAKQLGRNQFHIFDAALDSALKERQQVLGAIHNAVDTGELLLHYQPVVAMASGMVWGVEALIRWQHPRRGLLGPGEFLPFIAGTELVALLDQWVLGEAIKQCWHWRRQGQACRVSVNITVECLSRPGFLTMLRNLLNAHPGIDPSHLMLEILETAALDRGEYIHDILQACIDMGLRLVLDDFGTGYSALASLRHLPVHAVKIDHLLTRDLLTDAHAAALVGGVIQFVKAVDKQVIAEGVESEAIGTRLLDWGCELAQGFGVSAPLDATQLLTWRAQWTPFRSWSAAGYPAPAVKQPGQTG